MVCVSKAGDKQWQLFDVKADPGEKTDVAALHPDVVKELDAAYDQWWDSVQPQLVNENADGPKVNPFKELYWKQFGKEGEPHSDAQPSPGQWVVVAAPAFASSLTPLVNQRRAEGFKVSVIETTQVLTREQIRDGNGAPLRERLQQVFGRDAGPKYLLLIGVGANLATTVPAEVSVPALFGTVARMKGQPTDYGYCLPDSAGRPTVAVGRFPARNSEELRGMIAKTLGLERARSSGEWRGHMLLVQGNPGGGSMAESFLDGITRPRLARLHPAWQLSAISDLAPSLYYLPTGLLQSRSLEWLSAGQLFAVYLGHSGYTALCSLNTFFLGTKDWAKVDMSKGQGVFFSCGCYGCQWDSGPEQAYCLVAMRNPTGPAAVIGACGESFSACGLLAVDGLLRCCTEAPFPARLADYWLAVQDGLFEGKIDGTTFTFLDHDDGTAAKVPLAVQRSEHLEMWTMLGDPGLRLPLLPLTISMKAASPVSPATRLNIEGGLPENLAGARVRVSLERTIGTRPGDCQALPEPSANGTAERDRIAAENNRKVNSRTISTATATAQGRSFACSLEVPANLAVPMVVVRAFAEAGTEIAEGVLKLPAGTSAGR